jgi:hypothetical protein
VRGAASRPLSIRLSMENVHSSRPLNQARRVQTTECLPMPFSVRGGQLYTVYPLDSPLPWNSPKEIGTATFSINVNSRNPTAKIPAATRNSVIVG